MATERLFAGQSLAARVERAECRLLAECAAATARRTPDAGVFVRSIGGGLAAFSGPGSPLNKLAGLGFEQTPSESALAEIEQAFHARGAAVQAEVSTVGDPAVGVMLTRRGYRLQGFEHVLGRALPVAASPGPDGVVVTEVAEAGFQTWLDIVVTGFASPDVQGVPSHESFPRDVLERAIADMATAEGFRWYLAMRDGKPAGAASLRLCDGVAQLTGAATLPEHRRRGVQGALLAARLAAAGAHGDVAVVTTQPGSKSQQNAWRCGFELLYARAVFVQRFANTD